MPKSYQLHLKGTVGNWNFSADMVSYILDKYKDKEVNVLIDSLGGRVDSALSISSLFSIHGNVHCHFVGMCASAATIAPMGAKRVTMDADALILVHKCMNLVFEWDYMNADELEAHIQELQKMKADQATIDGCIAGMYAKRCKKSKDELLALMKEGAWLTAKQALEWGFIDEITNAPEDAAPVVDESTLSVINSAGLPMPPAQSSLKKGSLMERFFQFLSAPFTHSEQSEHPEDTPDTAAESVTAQAAQPSQPSIMAKTLTRLAALIGCAIEFTENHFSLTDEMAGKIEDHLEASAADIAKKDEEIASLKATIAERDQTIADLRKEPAAPSAAVVEPANRPDEERPVDDVNKNVDWLMRQLS
jgi:ATP-dependent protease ClpP protease subunit/cell division protein FtsB